MKLSASSKLYEHISYIPISESLTQARKKVSPSFLSQFDYECVQTPSNFLVDPDCWIGIEVEVEKITTDNLQPALAPGLVFWQSKTDNSLKDLGREFVSLPLRGAPLVMAVNHLDAWLKFKNPNHVFSQRCGLHIHVGCRYMTIEQVVRFLLLYLITENIFFDQAGNRRSENNFCVPLGDSIPALKLPELFWFLENKEYDRALDTLLNGWKKYAALNVKPLSELGTIEFRHYLGTSDPSFILKQINLIQSLRRYAIRVSTETLTRQINVLNTMSTYSAFVEQVLGITDYYDPNHLKLLMEGRILQAKSIMSYVPFLKSFGFKFRNSPLFKKLGIKCYTREEYEKETEVYNKLMSRARISGDDMNHFVVDKLFKYSDLPHQKNSIPKEFQLS